MTFLISLTGLTIAFFSHFFERQLLHCPSLRQIPIYRRIFQASHCGNLLESTAGCPAGSQSPRPAAVQVPALQAESLAEPPLAPALPGQGPRTQGNLPRDINKGPLFTMTFLNMDIIQSPKSQNCHAMRRDIASPQNV